MEEPTKFCTILGCMYCGKSLPIRYVIAILVFSGIIVAYGQRVCINLAITTMVKSQHTSNPECPAQNSSSKKILVEGGEHNWDTTQVDYILGSFFAGYCVPQIPLGVLSDRMGARHVLGTGMIISTILSAISPSVINYTPWQWIPVLRVFLGIAQSVIYPSVSTLYAKWIPVEERSTIGSLSFGANALGVTLGGLISGLVLFTLQDWRYAFYIWVIFGVIWIIFFYLYGYSDPQSHPHISAKEVKHIHDNIYNPRKHMKIPWNPIFKDMAVWALIIACLGHDYTIFTLITHTPKYISEVLNYDIKDNTLLTSFPYLAQWIGCIIAGKLCDYLYVKKGYSLPLLRNICTFIGLTLPVLVIMIGSYMGCRGVAVSICLAVSLFLKGAFYSGARVNHLDLTVNFAGVLMAVVNGLGAVMGFISSQIIVLMTKQNTLQQWRNMYWVLTVFCVCANLISMIFSRTRRAQWDVPDDELEEYLKETERIKADKHAKKEEKRLKKEEKRRKKAEDKAKN